jgi:ribosome-associated heat shock protein Hsp15
MAEDDKPLPPGLASTRADRWLWEVRLLKTRAEPAQTCRGAHVRINDQPAKPASTVRDAAKGRLNDHAPTGIVG